MEKDLTMLFFPDAVKNNAFKNMKIISALILSSQNCDLSQIERKYKYHSMKFKVNSES